MRTRRKLVRPGTGGPAGRYAYFALAALIGLLVAGGASGSVAAQDIEEINRELADIEGELTALLQDRLDQQDLRSPTFVEERLTDGELFYRLQDYVRASIIFTDIVEHYPQHRAYPNALFLLGDSLFHARDYLGARSRFREIIESAEEERFRPYVQRALGRLIEIAIHTRDFEGVDDYFHELSRLPPTEIEAATAYYRAKYLYNRAVPTDEVVRERSENDAPVSINLPMLESARNGFEGVAQGSPYYPQARYFIGVVHTLREEYPQAIEAFRRVLRAPVQSVDHEAVVELTQLSLGRLYYETLQLDQAIEAYQSVPRTSSRFDTALYEIAWVYIRQGDVTRAERALEVLSIASPDSKYIPDAQLLRGNLLLRDGRMEDAEAVFRDVRRQFRPVRRDLDAVLEEHADPRAYFQRLVRENMASFDANTILPPTARQYANLESEMDRALSVLSDLSHARQLVSETGDLVARLNAALSTPNPANVFPDLRRHLRSSTAIRNRVARVRRSLMEFEGRRVPEGSVELRQVRERRRQIETTLGRMPTEDDDFAVRDDQMLARYRRLQRELSAVRVELLGIEARITATEHFLRQAQTGQTDIRIQAADAEPIRTELAQHREALLRYREQVALLERTIEVARLQIGVGDRRYVRDERMRSEYNELVARERRLMAAAGIEVPRGFDGAFGRATELEARLGRHDEAVRAMAERRVREMRVVIDEESDNLVNYRAALSELEDETEEVVGAITYHNFRAVRHRFYDLVLRADVGTIDVAWAQREEHRRRVDTLTRQRGREIQALDDEFREIMEEEQNEGARPSDGSP